MTLRFLTDENFVSDILQGVLKRNPSLDIIRVQDVNLSATDDLIILEWAAKENRILLTHDVNTMTKYAYERINAGQSMPGVVEISLRVSIGKAVEEILVLSECTLEGELEGQVVFLPL